MSEVNEQMTKNERTLTEIERAVYRNYLQYCQRVGARPALAAEYFRVMGRF